MVISHDHLRLVTTQCLTLDLVPRDLFVALGACDWLSPGLICWELCPTQPDTQSAKQISDSQTLTYRLEVNLLMPSQRKV
eukprot:3614232-Amphidinium_carterae.1